MANNYEFPVSQLLTYGDPRDSSDWPDYLALGLTAKDVPELIRLATDSALLENGTEGEGEPPLETWGSVHAWRALGQLHAESATEPLIGLWDAAGKDEGTDDWLLDDLPEALGMIGAPALPALSAYVNDPAHNTYARAAAGYSLGKAAEIDPQLRGEVVRLLTQALEHYAENDEYLNTILVAELVDLKAIESAAVIKAAFYADRVDPMFSGAWPDAKEALGLEPDAEVPGPEPALLEVPSLFEDIYGTSNPDQSLPHKANRKAKSKRKQEKKSRKQNRKPKKKKK